jgi:protein phosphatase 2C-like protein
LSTHSRLLDVRPVPGLTIGDPGRSALEIRPGTPTRPWSRPDTAVDAATMAGLEVRAASRRGLYHKYAGTPRQDAYSLAVQGDGAGLVVTVCDGLGSMANSHHAADLVCAGLPELLVDAVEDLAWTAAFQSVSADVTVADAEAGPMATTVVAGVFRTGPDRTTRVRLASVGDSSAWLLSAGRWRRLLPAPNDGDGEDGGVADARTSALPAERPEHEECLVELSPGDAVFLMTDGVGTPLDADSGEVADALAELWAAPPEDLDFAAQVGFARRSFDDDRTVVGVWLPPAELGERRGADG